jgi:putative holliday junction resolvase
VGGILAIDHGSAKSGFASADRLRIAVAALPPVRLPGDGPELLEHVARLTRERESNILLVGVPLDGEGGETAQSARVRAFAARLARRLPELELVFWDERLTTQAARDLLVEEGLPLRRRKELRDSYSALVLLRDWLAAGEPRT